MNSQLPEPPDDGSDGIEEGLDFDSIHYQLVLYVAGASQLSLNAITRIRDICDNELAGRVELDVVDVNQQPGLVVKDDIVAVPTLLRKLPSPLRRLVGDLSTQRVLVALDLRPRPEV